MSKRISVLSVPIDCITMDEAVSKIIEMTKQSGLHLVATANAEMVMLANQDPVLHGILNSASLVVPDGAGILWAAERMGERVPERVTGVDITKEVFKQAVSNQIPIYCLGAAPGVAQQAVSNLQAMYGTINIAGIHDGFLDEAEEQRIINDIKTSGAKLVFVALGVPKQEQWMSSHRGLLHGVMVGVGAGFDYHAGNLKRAPRWMQRCNLEWLYRLMQEPKRLLKRYIYTNLKFLWLIIRGK